MSKTPYESALVPPCFQKAEPADIDALRLIAKRTWTPEKNTAELLPNAEQLVEWAVDMFEWMGHAGRVLEMSREDFIASLHEWRETPAGRTNEKELVFGLENTRNSLHFMMSMFAEAMDRHETADAVLKLEDEGD